MISIDLSGANMVKDLGNKVYFKVKKKKDGVHHNLLLEKYT